MAGKRQDKGLDAPRGAPSSDYEGGRPRTGDLAHQLEDLARSLAEGQDVSDTLAGIVASAVETVPGAEAATVSVVRRGREMVTVAASSDLGSAADRAQQDADEGPCLDSLYEHATVRVPDLEQEDRWPRFAQQAVEHGVRSMLSLQLFTTGDDLGAMNLSSSQADAFDDESEDVALLFASHAAIALAAAQRYEHLRRAVSTRDLIGQAKGILMERHRLSSESAFQVLVRASQTTNRKLHDVADELVHSGVVPGQAPESAAG